MSQNKGPPLSKPWTSEVSYISKTNLIRKTFLPEFIDNGYPTERSAYERFTANGPPTTIPGYFGADDSKPHSILLESVSKGDVWRFVKENHDDISNSMIAKWIQQAASALAFAHKLGVLHCDIHQVNCLLDANLDLKVADWAGASIDGIRARGASFYRRTHSLPGATASVKMEIFALGSVAYFMLAGHDVFPELGNDKEDKNEITRRFAKGEWPSDLDRFGELGDIVRGCWECKFKTMEKVAEAVEKTPYLWRVKDAAPT